MRSISTLLERGPTTLGIISFNGICGTVIAKRWVMVGNGAQ